MVDIFINSYYFSFKGAQPATRYEVASVVARALAKVDAEKASKQDLEMLKKLVMEFKDELDALGVKVDKIDKRVAVMEDRLGGWKLNGQFRFDAKFADNEDGAYTTGSDRAFSISRWRFHISKQIDENTSFYARLDGKGGNTAPTWAYAYGDAKLPYDINFRFGRFCVDWEADHGFYHGSENDGSFYDFDVEGFQFARQFGIVHATAVVARNFSIYNDEDGEWDGNASMHYGLKLHADFNEKFRGGATMWRADNDTNATAFFGDVNTYSVYAGFDFTPAVTLQGMYYWQDSDVFDSTKSWKAQLNIKQDLLKFTSLWIEYAQEDNQFVGLNRASGAYDNYANILTEANWKEGTSKIWFVRADQKWNDKWSTFLRYTKADLDVTGMDDVSDWTVGVKHQYTPALSFELLYDKVDYGKLAGERTYEDDSLIRFRTYLVF